MTTHTSDQTRAQTTGALTMIFGTASAMMVMLGIAIAAIPAMSPITGA